MTKTTKVAGVGKLFSRFGGKMLAAGGRSFFPAAGNKFLGQMGNKFINTGSRLLHSAPVSNALNFGRAAGQNLSAIGSRVAQSAPGRMVGKINRATLQGFKDLGRDIRRVGSFVSEQAPTLGAVFLPSFLMEKGSEYLVKRSEDQDKKKSFKLKDLFKRIINIPNFAAYTIPSAAVGVSIYPFNINPNSVKLGRPHYYDSLLRSLFNRAVDNGLMLSKADFDVGQSLARPYEYNFINKRLILPLKHVLRGEYHPGLLAKEISVADAFARNKPIKYLYGAKDIASGLSFASIFPVLFTDDKKRAERFALYGSTVGNLGLLSDVVSSVKAKNLMKSLVSPGTKIKIRHSPGLSIPFYALMALSPVLAYKIKDRLGGFKNE